MATSTALTTTSTQSAADKAIEAIAARYLDMPTLATRKSDSLDFYDLAVWQIKTALQEAYLAGAGRAPAPK